MKSEIKQRIDQLNNGVIPDGYKKTDFGVFPCDWVTDRTFGDLFEFYGGLGKSRDELGEEGYAYLHYGDLHRGSFNCVSLEQYSQLPKCDITLKGKESCLMEDGDVAFLDASEDLEGTSRTVLIDNPENKPFIAGLHIIYGKSKDDSLEKWYKQYITSSESVKKQFQRLSVGFKVYGVNRDSLPKIRIAYPTSLQEQSRIAEILMKWDEAIDLYNRQIDQLKRFKSICLKKMFPLKGKTVPEWRFLQFTGAWEQRKLGDIANIIDPHPSHRAPAAVNEGIPFIGIGDVDALGNIDKESARTVEEAIYDEHHRRYNLDIPSLGIGRVASLGKVIRLRNDIGKYAVSPTMSIIQFQDTVDIDYMYSCMESPIFQKQFASQSSGSTRQSVGIQDLRELQVSIPKNEYEQKQIGRFFKEVDNLIALHQRKVETAEKQRAVLQQYLLNGIVRVKK